MLKISFACWDYDRTLPIMDGRVAIEGCELQVNTLNPQQLFPRLLQNQEFDVSELSISSYMLQHARGDSAYTAIPVFPSRFFRHGGIFVRSDAGIEKPKDSGRETHRHSGIPDDRYCLEIKPQPCLYNPEKVATSSREGTGPPPGIISE